MGVSANTLFHFTDRKENLEGILKNYFFPKYSLEDISNATPDISTYKTAHIPMVCFCDLLFSQIKSHIDFYGDYGIGLRKKEWGIKKGISPIFYFPKEASSAKLIQSLANAISSKTKNPREKSSIRKELQNFYKCMKPYDGIAFNKKDKRMEDRIFYNEREWRFTPKKFPVLPENNSATKIKEANAEMQDTERLAFKAQDVKYIIVKEEKEIPDFVSFIEKELTNQFQKQDEIKLLVSKLISVEQIKDDM